MRSADLTDEERVADIYAKFRTVLTFMDRERRLMRHPEVESPTHEAVAAMIQVESHILTARQAAGDAAYR